MRNVFFILSVVVFLSACNSASTKTEKEKKFEVKTTQTFILKPEVSKLSWNRQVDYKFLKKRMKIFGAYADVSLENVQLETSGNAAVRSGNIIVIDDEFTSAEVEIDLTLTRFYSDDEESFFESESYEPAKLVIKSFALDALWMMMKYMYQY